MNARESSLIRLVKALNAWDTPDFETALKAEIERLPAAALPLQHGMSKGSVVLDRPINAMVIAASEDGGFIHVKAGIFFSSMLAGCACADDPTPVEEQSEYCALGFEINEKTGEATVTLLPD